MVLHDREKPINEGGFCSKAALGMSNEKMPMTRPVHICSPVDNSTFALPKELARQSAYFADVFMTRHLLDAMPGMVLVLNGHRQIVFANRAFYQLADWPDSANPVGLLVGDVLS